ncbi:MAG: hypothetical protein U5L04_01660 [Trueperaceae bacterium]|nr:hypothetical protein [Trueperaceae bacterium]
MTDIGTQDVKDVDSDMLAVDDGSGNWDFSLVSGDERVGALVLRSYVTAPGEIHSDPEWGQDLRRYKSEPAKPGLQLDIARRAKRAAGAIEGVDASEITVSRAANGVWIIRTQIRTNGRSYKLPEVTLG